MPDRDSSAGGVENNDGLAHGEQLAHGQRWYSRTSPRCGRNTRADQHHETISMAQKQAEFNGFMREGSVRWGSSGI